MSRTDCCCPWSGLRLFALDVALTEAAIGSGVTGVLLITAAIRLRGTDPPPASEQLRPMVRLAAAMLCVVIAGILAAGVLMMADPGRRWHPTWHAAWARRVSAILSRPSSWRFAPSTRCSRRSC